jgi:hypothetical protein
MSNPTEIIVYRNPAEYALWNSGMLFPIICSAVAAIVAVIVVAELTERMGAYSKLRSYIIIGSGILSAIITYNLMAF